MSGSTPAFSTTSGALGFMTGMARGLIGAEVSGGPAFL